MSKGTTHVVFRLAAVPICCLLMASCVARTPLHDAAARGDVRKIRDCLGRGMEVNAKDEKGNTPLHYAYYHGRQKAIERLVAFGGDPTVRNENGHTAKEMREIAEAEALLGVGARLLDRHADWRDRKKGLKVYMQLQNRDDRIVTRAIVRKVVRDENRLRVLFLAVKLGIPGSEKHLNRVLQAYGDKCMAEDYLNSGSQALFDGGKRWARQHGYSVRDGMGSHRVAWGRF